MKTELFHIPTNLSGFKIRHSKALVDLNRLKDVKKMRIGDKVNLCAKLIDKSPNDLKKYNVVSINNLFDALLGVIDSYQMKPIPESIEVAGKKYNFILRDPSSLPVGWVIDFSASDYEQYPEKIVAMSYIEDGMTYNQTDQHRNIVNPNSARMEIFRQHISLDRYLDLSAFFLTALRS